MNKINLFLVGYTLGHDGNFYVVYYPSGNILTKFLYLESALNLLLDLDLDLE